MTNEFILASACKSGDLSEIKRLMPRISGVAPLNIAVFWASRYGRLSILRYLFEEAPKKVKLFPDATARGSLAVYEAAAAGDLDMLRYLVEEVPQICGQFVDISTPVLGSELCRYSAYRAAVEAGHFHVVEYLDKASEIQRRIKRELQEEAEQREALKKYIASLGLLRRFLAKTWLYRPKPPTDN